MVPLTILISIQIQKADEVYDNDIGWQGFKPNKQKYSSRRTARKKIYTKARIRK